MVETSGQGADSVGGDRGGGRGGEAEAGTVPEVGRGRAGQFPGKV